MSRVHDALRRAEQLGQLATGDLRPDPPDSLSEHPVVLAADYPHRRLPRMRRIGRISSAVSRKSRSRSLPKRT